MAEQRIELDAAGDRVRVRLADASRATPDALVIAYTGDGSCTDAGIGLLLPHVAPWAQLAAPDLPLCGARASNKLTAAAFDPDHALAAALLGDLRLQLADDLRELIATVPGAAALPAKRIAVLASGRALRAFDSFELSHHGIGSLQQRVEAADEASIATACQQLRKALDL